MILLVLGVALWIGAHAFKRVAPEARASLGDKGRGLVAGAILLSVVLMVLGYRAAPTDFVYSLPSWVTHLNNVLVLIAFYFFAVSGAKTRVHQKIRHPQLTGFCLWAFAHLLVNGDIASIVLFGGLLAWGVGTIAAINRDTPEWTPPPVPPMKKEMTTAGIALVLFGVVAGIHSAIGPSPFG